MSRAQGKHPQRGGILAGLAEDLAGLGGGEQETAGERRQEGIGDPRDIPGGKNHLANPPVRRQAVPVPATEWPYRDAMLAHGVQPDEAGHWPRDPRLTGGQRGAPRHQAPPPRATPVPVYLVQDEGGAGVTRSASPRHITVPASTAAEPARVCGVNKSRVEVRLLNEDTATDIRIARQPGDLVSGAGGVGGGALLPWPCNSYLALPTQDELYAIGAAGSGTPLLSIIEIFEEQAGG